MIMAFKLEPNEHVLLIARRHWFRPFYMTIGLLFTLIIPALLVSVAFSFETLSTQYGNLGILTIVISLIWFFLIWNVAFVVWTNHFLDVVVVTNLHIIDIEQISMWHREISMLSLDKVQDISSETKGMIASLLQYGDLEIQTAGSISNFILKGVEQPDLIRQKIMQQCNLSK